MALIGCLGVSDARLKEAGSQEKESKKMGFPRDTLSLRGHGADRWRHTYQIIWRG